MFDTKLHIYKDGDKITLSFDKWIDGAIQGWQCQTDIVLTKEQFEQFVTDYKYVFDQVK